MGNPRFATVGSKETSHCKNSYFNICNNFFMKGAKRNLFMRINFFVL